MAAANPYVGARPFRKGEELYGRKREAAELLDLLIAERIVLLPAPSGAGKTSLIEAALIPQLEGEEFGFEVLPTIRVSREHPGDFHGAAANRYILSTLLCLDEKLAPEQRSGLDELSRMTLSGYLRQRPQADHNPNNDFLIFDQFEEILTIDINDDDGRHAFFGQLGEALRDHKIWALFAMREEYVTALSPFLRPVPTGFATAFRLDFLDAAHAREAIQKPAKKCGVTFADDAADELVKNLRGAGNYVEPLHLQIVCRHLWEQCGFAAGPVGVDANKIGLDDVLRQNHGNIDSALEAYYAECLRQASAKAGIPERAVREWIDQHLITAQGIRAQLARGTGEATEGLASAAIEQLIQSILIRVEKRRDIEWLELAHDRLIRPIRNNNGKWYAENLSALQRAAQLWDCHGRDRGLLLQGQSLDDAIAWVRENPAKLNELERDFFNACEEARNYRNRERKKNGWIAVTAVAAIVACIAALFATGFFVAEKERAEQEKTNALLASVDARSARDEAELNARFAQQEAQRALLAERLSSARALANTATRQNQRPDLGLLLALAATRDEAPLDIQGGLLTALTANPNLLTYIHGHAGAVRSVAYSGDGGLLVSAGDDGQIRLWDTARQWLAQAPLPARQGAIFSIALDPGGGLLASGGKDGSVLLWDLKTRDHVALAGASGAVRGLAFSPDGRWLAAAGRFEEIHLWNTSDKNVKAIDVQPQSLPIPDGGAVGAVPKAALPESYGSHSVHSLAFADKRTLAAGIYETRYESGKTVRSGQVVLWDIESRKILHAHASRQAVNSVAFRPAQAAGGTANTRFLAAATSEGDIQLWNVKQREPDIFYAPDRSAHAIGIAAIAFSPDGENLAGAEANRGVIVLDSSGKMKTRFATGEVIHHLAIAPDGNTLAAASDDGTVALFSIQPVHPHPLARSLPGAVHSVAWQSGLLVAADHQSLNFFHAVPELRRASDRDALPNPAHKMTRMVSSPDGKILAWFGAPPHRVFVSGDGAATQETWSAEVKPQLAKIDSVAVSSDGLLAIGGAGGKEVELWKRTAASGSSPRYQAYRSFSVPRAASRPGRESGREEAEGASMASALALAFSPDGKTLACGSSENAVIVWDLANEQAAAIRLEQGITRDVTALAFSPDGKLLASGGKEGAVILWNPSAREQLVRLRDHEDAVLSLAFSPDGRILASGGADQRIILWDAQTWLPFGAPLETPGKVASLSFSPDLRQLQLASASGDGGQGYLWDLRLASWRDAACSIAARNLTSAESALYLRNQASAPLCAEGLLNRAHEQALLDAGAPAQAYAAAAGLSQQRSTELNSRICASGRLHGHAQAVKAACERVAQRAARDQGVALRRE